MRYEGTTVYVPTPNSQLRNTIKPGSGIVGTTQDDGRILIDYEGALYGALERPYEDKLFQAWGRHVEHYPTIARSLVDAAEVVEVGQVIVPGPASDADVAAELRRQTSGRVSPPVSVLARMPEFRQFRKELEKPRFVINEPELVDGWVNP